MKNTHSTSVKIVGFMALLAVVFGVSSGSRRLPIKKFAEAITHQILNKRMVKMVSEAGGVESTVSTWYLRRLAVTT